MSASVCTVGVPELFSWKLVGLCLPFESFQCFQYYYILDIYEVAQQRMLQAQQSKTSASWLAFATLAYTAKHPQQWMPYPSAH